MNLNLSVRWVFHTFISNSERYSRGAASFRVSNAILYEIAAGAIE